MTALDLTTLPNLPQCHSLQRFAPIFWEQADVRALWIGGSLARGDADRYSDIDLRVAVEPARLESWRQPDLTWLFAGECLAQTFLSFGDAFLHHIVLTDGTIYDLWLQSVERPPSAETVLVLGCRDEKFASLLRAAKPPPTVELPPANGESVQQAIMDFWINTHKHRKVLARELEIVALSGIDAERRILARLWQIHATGRDPGHVQPTIFGLTEQAREIERARGRHALEVLGASLTDRAAICAAIMQLRAEVSQVGQQLAASLEFAYPHALEQMVRQQWQEFIEGKSDRNA